MHISGRNGRTGVCEAAASTKLQDHRERVVVFEGTVKLADVGLKGGGKCEWVGSRRRGGRHCVSMGQAGSRV